MDAGGDIGSAAKGSAISLEVAGSGPVGCRFFIPFSFLPCVVLQPVFQYMSCKNCMNTVPECLHQALKVGSWAKNQHLCNGI